MEAAVPPYRSDAQASATAVGELYMYVKQLTARVEELAVQANTLDDERLAAQERIRELEQKLNAAHAHNDELRGQLYDYEVRVNERDCDCCK